MVTPIMLTVRFAVLYGFWIVLSGRFESKYLIIGALCTLVVTFLTQDLAQSEYSRIAKPARTAFSILSSAWSFLCYSTWLLWSIVQSSLQVAYLVLHPRLPIRPGLLRFRTALKSQTGHIILANSITLTPGTITVDLSDGTYTVHALVPEAAEALLNAKMQSKLEKVFGEIEETTTEIQWIDRPGDHRP